jgi:tetratricopeptide (TPR) repeat protein
MNFIEKIKEFDIEKRIELLEDYLKKHPEDGIGAYRYLSHLYTLKGDLKRAEEILKKGVQNNPQNLWLKLMLGDFYFFTLKNEGKAEEIYKEILSHFDSPVRSTLSPYRYVLKRLTTIAYNKGNFDEAKKFYEMFYAIEPSDFYASDFLKYAEILYKSGEVEKAKSVIDVGIRTHPKKNELKEFANKFLNGSYTIESRTYESEVKKIPVKTPIIKEDDDIIEIVKNYAGPLLEKGDIVTISSCVAAIAEGRIYPVDAIKVSPIARFVSRFVNQESVPFGGAAPLANPYAMQVAIEEVGSLRILLGFVLGAIGKIFGFEGVFYRVGGPQTALIDDPPGAIPPYDYYVIPGPKDSNKLAEKIKNTIGFDVAIVDANELGRAWVVGASGKIDKKRLEKVLTDNPAGNEDEGTPIVIVRGFRY